MTGSKYSCPLCHQPVSSSLFMQITGIWKAREKELSKIKTERANLKKMQKQFKIQKGKLIKSAIQKSTRRYETKMKILKAREKKIQDQANKKIAKAVKEAHFAEQLKSKSRELKIERRLKYSMKKEIKAARQNAMSDVKVKYRKWQISLQAATKQIRGMTEQNKNQQKRIKDLEDQIKKQTTPQIEGLLYEKELMKQLQKRFKDDKFVNTGKGGDIIHSIINNEENIGTIVYECKRVKNYVSKHVKQIYDAKHARKAEFGVLVTNAMKKGTNGFFIEKGVIVVHSTGVLHVANILRKQIVQISDMKLGQTERERVVKNILKYLESPEFSNSVSSIIQDSVFLYNELVNEVKRHYKVWKERYSLYSRINSEANAIQGNTNALLSGKEIEDKKGSMLPALVELPKVSDESQS